MSTTDRLHVELNTRQQDLLLEGLRYITSSVRLRREDPTEETVALRREQLTELRELAALIEGNATAEMAVNS
ncbi:hypothetical protein [Rubinisphaera italica]|uniref:Uncharacterized protein n=1 Tax=Rubinisphaera italica TaxID=2527969 RepID=A0A5C5XFS5_9PLAN|nr:hypothetical protein [Rubinisphaera italica]TWT61840.1 hypothetical protein Pan54_25770 [Rubinisphaera italica]HBN75976.1 hypothetical protein [Planctomycetaceae bacterium]